MKYNGSIIHGVFLNIFNTGTLITGASASGKSTLALALVQRNHQLIADDAPQFDCIDNQLYGTCPQALQDLLHIRELGFLNIRQLFGNQAIRERQALNLIIQLQKNNLNAENPTGNWSRETLFGIDILTLSLPTISQHLIMLIETAVRCYQLNPHMNSNISQFTTNFRQLIS